MSLNRRILLCAVVLLSSGLFVRLGFWQLSRRAERVSGVEARAVRAAQSLLDWATPSQVPDDTAGLVGRRARLTGRWDRASEVILRSRTFDGRPGVEILTPLLLGSGVEEAPAVMVLRGWLPATDGLRADLGSGWARTDGERVEIRGVLISSRDGRGGQPLWVEVAGARHLALGGIDLAQVREQLRLDVSRHVLRADDPEFGVSALRPARQIQIGSGPHLSYAIQWFSFAAITLIGTVLLIRKERAREPPKVL